MEIPQKFQVERTYLVGIEIKGSKPLLSVHESLAELELLARTAGLEVVGRTHQNVARPDPKTFIGSGKVEEVKIEVTDLDVKTVIFDDELSPRHQRELEKIFGEEIKVLDRSALILDIFAQHAQTHEGRLQVELAQYEYLLPRLTRQWTHLERQAGGGAARGGAGGVGLRGPGETQLEVDRRAIGKRISRLKSELENVRAHRSRHRAQRHRAGIPVVAMVGYTNAGKSTLMNALTAADVYVADQLFATLDPTTRKIALPSSKEVLVSDTVGFIQKLPTTLVAAFRATLEEVLEADVLLHVVDSAHPYARAHIETVEDTLAEIDMPRVPRILVLNKQDLWQDENQAEKFEGLDYDQVVAVSAQKKQGLDALLETIEKVIQRSLVPVEFFVPYQQGELIALARKLGVIKNETHTPEGVLVQGDVPPALAARLAQEKLTR
ncbi:MAG: GTPase HflX [Anaerolineae bacterium]|nr:GTPase HflX [Anaerolineae bacterium]